MRTLSPGSDFFRSQKGALSYLNAHFKLGGDSVKMIFGGGGFVFFAFSGWAEHLGCSVHLEERQFCPHHPFVFEADVTRPATTAGWRRT